MHFVNVGSAYFSRIAVSPHVQYDVEFVKS